MTRQAAPRQGTPSPPIDQILPHRAPMLFVHEVVEVDARGAHCRFHLPVSGDCFSGRMGIELVMVEALAQTTAVMMSFNEPRSVAGGMLGGVDRYRVEARPDPGETLDLHVEVVKRLGPVALFEVEARRGPTRLCSGTMSVRLGGDP
jgi:3-hydroxyacyl-[acyl-carrier-protein] dehydratase